MMDDEESGGLHLVWELIIFFAAIASVTSVIIELTVHVPEETEAVLHAIDFSAICLFAVDLAWKYQVMRHHHGRGVDFIRSNWLDIIAIIPLFRVFRLGRFARFARLARIRKSAKAAGEIQKGASTLAHSRHVRDEVGHLRRRR